MASLVAAAGLAVAWQRVNFALHVVAVAAADGWCLLSRHGFLTRHGSLGVCEQVGCGSHYVAAKPAVWVEASARGWNLTGVWVVSHLVTAVMRAGADTRSRLPLLPLRED